MLTALHFIMLCGTQLDTQHCNPLHKSPLQWSTFRTLTTPVRSGLHAKPWRPPAAVLPSVTIGMMLCSLHIELQGGTHSEAKCVSMASRRRHRFRGKMLVNCQQTHMQRQDVCKWTADTYSEATCVQMASRHTLRSKMSAWKWPANTHSEYVTGQLTHTQRQNVCQWPADTIQRQDVCKWPADIHSEAKCLYMASRHKFRDEMSANGQQTHTERQKCLSMASKHTHRGKMSANGQQSHIQRQNVCNWPADTYSETTCL